MVQSLASSPTTSGPSLLEELVIPVSYILVIYWLWSLTNLVLAVIGGFKPFDPDFTGLRLRPPVRLQRRWRLLGFFAVLLTFPLMVASTYFDLSTVLPLTALSVVYIVLLDIHRGSVRLGQIVVPATLVTIGVALASLRTLALQFTWQAILLLGVFQQATSAFRLDYLKRSVAIEGVSQSETLIWRSLWSALWTTVFAIPFLILTRELQLATMVLSSHTFLYALPLILGRLVLGSYSALLQQASLRGHASSTVSLLGSVDVMLAVPITAIVNSFCFQCLGIAPQTIVYAPKFLGSICIVAGAWLILRMKERVFVFGLLVVRNSLRLAFTVRENTLAAHLISSPNSSYFHDYLIQRHAAYVEQRMSWERKYGQ